MAGVEENGTEGEEEEEGEREKGTAFEMHLGLGISVYDPKLVGEEREWGREGSDITNGDKQVVVTVHRRGEQNCFFFSVFFSFVFS